MAELNPFEPAPRYRTASPVETARIALDLPLTPLNTLWEGAKQGVVDSFGLGTAIKDFQTPRGVPSGDDGALSTALRANPLAGGLVAGYEAARQMFGAPTTGAAMPEDEWKQSEFYRDGITWDAGMTTDRAAAIATQYDVRQAREYFGQKNMLAYIAGNFLGQIPDPINYVPVFGPAARAAAQAKFGFVAGHALIGASEAAINTAVFGAITTPFRGRLGEDVSWEASINNIAFSAIIGAAFGGLGGAWARSRSLRAMRAENESKIAMEDIRNLQDSRDVLNDAIASVVETGDVRLSGKSQTILERMTGEVIDRRMAVRALDAETAGVTGIKAGEVAIAPGGARVAVRPEVVEASTLQRASGALQVRDRSADNLANVTQVQDIALNLDPAKLMPSVDAGAGAPIVGPDNVVDSGNGRVAAINLAYDTYPERAAAYRQALVEAGYPEAAQMERPVLVSRRTTELSPEARAQFNAAANSSTTARMSAVELAAMDRAALTDGVLDVLDPDLPITATGNRAFVGRFLAQLPVNESTALYDKGGNLSADGVRRIENALVAAAYGDVDTLALRKFAEATDDNTRTIVGAMADVAGHWLSMRRAVQRGDVQPEFDATPELTEGLRRLSLWREQAAREGRPVGTVIREGLAQRDMLTGDIPPEAALFIRSFYRNDEFSGVVSREKIADRLKDIAQRAQAVGQPDMLGEAYAATKLGVMRRVYANDIEGDFLKVADDGGSLDQIGGTGWRHGADARGEGRAEATIANAGDRPSAAPAESRVIRSVNERIAERVNAEDRTRAQTIFDSDDALVELGIEVREGDDTFPRSFSGKDLGLREDQMAPSDGRDGSDAIVDGASLDPEQAGRVLDALNLPRGMTVADLAFPVFDDGAVVNVEVKDWKGLVERLKAETIQQREVASLADLDTLDDHAALAAGFREFLEASGIPYRYEDRGSASNYFTFDGADGEPIKVRFADHTRQSVFHEDATVNVAPGADRFSDAMEAAQRTVTPESERAALTARLLELADAGDVEAIKASPELEAIVADMQSRPATDGIEGYGTEAWAAARTYDTPDGPIQGVDGAFDYLLDRARNMAADELGIPRFEVAKERKAVIVIGPPAAGKSTIANELARRLRAAIPDADEAKKIMPEYDGGMGSNAVHEESSFLTGYVTEELKRSGENMVIPKVGGSEKSIAGLTAALKEWGYTVDTVLMDVEPTEAFRRMIGRFVSSGRLIPPRYFETVSTAPKAVFSELKTKGIGDGFATVTSPRGLPATLSESSLRNLDLERGAELSSGRRGSERGTNAGDVESAGSAVPAPEALRAPDTGTNAEYFDRPQPVVDMQEPQLPLEPDGLADASARVGRPETLDALAEQFGVDRKTGDFAEAAEIEALRAEGRLSPEDLAEIEAADRTAVDADAYAETLRVAAACVMG